MLTLGIISSGQVITGGGGSGYAITDGDAQAYIDTLGDVSTWLTDLGITQDEYYEAIDLFFIGIKNS